MAITSVAVLIVALIVALTVINEERAPNTVAGDVRLPGSPTFQKMQQRGRLVLGVRNDQPGLSLQDSTTGEFTGFDVGIGRMVAAGLGFGPDQIDYRVVPTASREDAIASGDVDLFIGTYAITDRRKLRVSFAGPYYLASQDLLVRTDDTTISSPQTLQGKRVCTATGSTPAQWVRQLNADIVEFQNYSQCVAALRGRQVDALTTDDAILAGYAAQTPGRLRVVGSPFADGESRYGIGLRRDDFALRVKINELFRAAETDGTWQRIYMSTLGASGMPVPQPPPLQLN